MVDKTKFAHYITVDFNDLPAVTYIGRDATFEYWRGHKTGIIYRTLV